jgi:hypothetical protein|tara:strand:- start:560 stop:814 length:255 start_codon:yes stop_codon:yes gene_type:complete
MGLRNTILEDGLQSLLDQCPDIVLNPRSIKLIIESGDFNQVISEYNGAVPLEDVGNDIQTSGGTLDKIKKIAKKKPKKKKQSSD